MNFQFEYIHFMWLLTAVILFGYLFMRVKKWKKRTIRKMGEAGLIKAMIGYYNPSKFNLKFILLCAAFIIGVFAVMGLRKPSGKDGIKREGIDVIFALDLSSSMKAIDINPSRLQKAQQFISKMINAMPNNRVGLVWFAGKAYMQMPLSNDHNAAQMFVNEASPDIIPMKGTVISDALEESMKAFGDREGKYKTLILISDGEDHDEKAINLSKELKNRGLMVNTIGIGSTQGGYILDDSTGDNKIDPETNTAIISKLNEPELKQIAANTNGLYVHLTNIDNAVKQVSAQLSQIDKHVTGDINLMSISYYFWCFAAIMLVLLVLDQLLPEGGKIATI